MERVLFPIEVSPGSALTIDAPHRKGSTRSWLLFVAKPKVEGRAAEVAVTLHCDAPDVAEGPRRRRRLAGPDWLALPYQGVGLPLRAEVSVTDPVLLEAYVLHSDGGLVVDVPMEMLGEHFSVNLPSVNEVLREIIGYSLADEFGGDLEAKKKKGKVYVCGLNKKNKGTKCTAVNVIVCGKKKDKKVLDDIPVDEIDSGEPSFSPTTQAFIELIADGGTIATETRSEQVDEFNELGHLFRALGLSQP